MTTPADLIAQRLSHPAQFAINRFDHVADADDPDQGSIHRDREMPDLAFDHLLHDIR